ncbi:hypothetical protein LWI28_021232 [Acer negundo]|uniref:PGG domain-containing protein n=1 Tax=Acer negundo TaxID=4023 RepID=A0AAD5JMY4_ACENE|nr:hypothetical protein LWI28_021232 [Acer negundo]KAK4856478.1 hypothetical protein QYF36_017909 [Acer negundo]
MKEATEANISDAVSSKIEKPDASSKSYNNIGETTASSSSDNQEIRNFELMDSLYSAAADGDISKFEEHSKHLDQILTPNGNTILHIHITARQPPRSRISQNMNFVREILGKCPELLWKANKKGETLLHMAARHGHADVAKYLLQECKKKPYQNDQELGIKNTRQMLQMINEAKDTALHEAVRYNHIDLVQLLIDEDRELPYDSNIVGETPLYLAAERGYAEILKKILDICISPADHGPNSRTALHATVIRNDKGMTKLLLDNGSIQKYDKIGWMPLHFAVETGYVEIAKLLLIKDRSTAYKADNKGRIVLHVAARHGRVNIMRELISICPGCCELVDKKGRNVLHYASKSKNRNAARLVLQNPSFRNLINEKDENGNTPFLLSASLLSIINHPKVDRLVFNDRNENAADVSSANRTLWKWHEAIRWLFIRGEISRGRRLMSNDKYGEGKENKSNPEVSSKSKDGNENRNDRSSRDDSVNKARRNELVAATLIATVTYAAGFTVPGGFISEKGPDQGASILIKNAAFKAFVILNSISMILSSLAVLTHLPRCPLDTQKTASVKMRFGKYLICCAMRAMIGAFLSGTCAVLYKDKNLAISACVVPVAMLAFINALSFVII